MKKPITKTVALDRLESLCSRSEQCEYDLRRKLAGWGIGVSDANEILDLLREERYVDDSRFAKAFTRDKYRFERWGRLKIKAALIQKRIASFVIAEALDGIDDEEYLDKLQSVLKAKAKSLGRDVADSYEGRGKMLRYAAARGYEPSMVMDMLRQIDLWGGSEE